MATGTGAIYVRKAEVYSRRQLKNEAVKLTAQNQ